MQYSVDFASIDLMEEDRVKVENLSTTFRNALPDMFSNCIAIEGKISR